MPQARFRQKTDIRIIFDGQSHNKVPAERPYPRWLMSGRPYSWKTVAIEGYSWTDLRPTASTRLFPHFLANTTNILIMNGGTQNIRLNQSGATAYADAVQYKNEAKAAGADYVIYTTIPRYGPLFGEPTAPQAQARLDHNVLVLANSGSFDAVANISEAPIDDTLDPDYFAIDRTHFTILGSMYVAEKVAPALDQVLDML